MAKLKITKTNSGVHDQYVSPTIVNGAHFGGTGGLTSQSGFQIQPQVYITGGSSLPGSILLQKGRKSFRVTDGTLKGDATLTNSPNLVAGQMNILVNLATIPSANVTAANVAGGATSTYVTWGTTPTGPFATPRVGDYIIGFTGTAGVAQVTAINTSSNVTIAVSGNVAAQTANITDSTYASRITNKFVYDFNGNKLRYRLATPDATFVQVQSA